MEDQELIQLAKDARKNSYAPFSKFEVGAALLTKDGKVFQGVNVENSSFGLTVCAERSALFAAISNGQAKNSFAAIAIASPGGAAPCGACRQVINELAADARILLVDSGGNKTVTESSIRELLPKSFNLDSSS